MGVWFNSKISYRGKVNEALLLELVRLVRYNIEGCTLTFDVGTIYMSSRWKNSGPTKEDMLEWCKRAKNYDPSASIAAWEEYESDDPKERHIIFEEWDPKLGTPYVGCILEWQNESGNIVGFADM